MDSPAGISRSAFTLAILTIIAALPSVALAAFSPQMLEMYAGFETELSKATVLTLQSWPLIFFGVLLICAAGAAPLLLTNSRWAKGWSSLTIAGLLLLFAVHAFFFIQPILQLDQAAQ